MRLIVVALASYLESFLISAGLSHLKQSPVFNQ
jgi:hypothetical protein